MNLQAYFKYLKNTKILHLTSKSKNLKGLGITRVSSYIPMKKRLGLLDYKDWALDAIVGKKDFLNLSVRHLKSDTWFLLRNS